MKNYYEKNGIRIYFGNIKKVDIIVTPIVSQRRCQSDSFLIDVNNGKKTTVINLHDNTIVTLEGRNSELLKEYREYKKAKNKNFKVGEILKTTKNELIRIKGVAFLMKKGSIVTVHSATIKEGKIIVAGAIGEDSAVFKVFACNLKKIKNRRLSKELKTTAISGREEAMKKKVRVWKSIVLRILAKHLNN